MNWTDRNWFSDYIRAGKTPTAHEILEALSGHQNARIRRRVAENESTPASILKKLSEDSDPDVRLAAGTNRSAPLEIVLDLVHDPDPSVRHGLAEDPYISVGVLRSLANDENPYVSCRAQKTLAGFYDRLAKERRQGKILSFPFSTGSLDCLAT